MAPRVQLAHAFFDFVWCDDAGAFGVGFDLLDVDFVPELFPCEPEDVDPCEPLLVEAAPNAGPNARARTATLAITRYLRNAI